MYIYMYIYNAADHIRCSLAARTTIAAQMVIHAHSRIIDIIPL